MIKLTLPQRQILYGIILGDGYLQKTGRRNARLRLEHGEKQKEYLMWKIEKLKNLFQGGPKYLERFHPKTGRKYCYWRHQSQSTPLLGKLRRIFYPQGKKTIPENLQKYLSPQTLAVWYMDDGYYGRRDNSGYLYLGKVTNLEAKRVSEALLKVFGLKTKILNKKKKGFVIYFPPTSLKKLKKIIQKYILFYFDYKLPSGPVTTCSKESGVRR